MNCRSSLRHRSRTVASVLLVSLLAMSGVTSAVGAGVSDPGDSRTAAPRSRKPRSRADSLVAITSRLGVNADAFIADIGAGKGRDSWVFARIVGKKGRVFSEEITPGAVDSLKEESQARGLEQVHPVLGRTDDPCLPSESVDLAYMNHVYHHLAKPREMLRGIRRSLKPGGHLVIIDQRRGTLRDWVPRQVREKRHFWIAETTVVREAREEGYVFVCCAEDCWHSKRDFVLVFQRPKELLGQGQGQDPDAFLPLSARECSQYVLPIRGAYQHPVFIALGEGRKLIPPILRHSRNQALDVILEEWATQKDERAPLPPGLSLPSTLTESGDPDLDSEPIDVAFFFDSYHLLFHGKTLLAKLRERLSPTGCIYVLDRRSDKPLSRRDASHRRMIEPETVKQEMADAGFHFWFRGPQCAPDRFLLVFGKQPADRIEPDDDPFIGGPTIHQEPGRWLRANTWRLRGMKTAGGDTVFFDTRSPKAEDDIVRRRSSSESPVWEIRGQGITLCFEKDETAYILRECKTGERQN